MSARPHTIIPQCGSVSTFAPTLQPSTTMSRSLAVISSEWSSFSSLLFHMGDRLRQHIQTWLSPLDPWKNHSIIHTSRHSGTGEWFVRGDTFSQWKSSGQSSLLWIYGKRQLLLSHDVFVKGLIVSPSTAVVGKSVLWYLYFSIFLS